jgi:dipeptidyl aminopeptidase/acylaminoacyl peptidase
VQLPKFLLVALTQIATAAHQSTDIKPEIVVVPSGALQLKALLWLPENGGPFPAVLFNHGSGSSDAMHTGPFMITEAAEKLGPIFLKHGYAFLYLFRRGQGLSADQGDFMQKLLQREKMANGEEARKSLQFRLLTTDHLTDVVAGLSFLTKLPRVDANRIAMAGHSFGGQLSLLAAERDNRVCAAVTFGAAAGSWEDWPELRQRLLSAVRKTSAPLMFIHAANDYSTAPGDAMAAERKRINRPQVLKIYSAVGKTSEEGHNFVYSAVDHWETDVFKFLDANVR